MKTCCNLERPFASAKQVGAFVGLVLIAGLFAYTKHLYREPVSLVNSNVAFENPNFDFGIKMQNERIEHGFRLLNHGEESVVVVGVHTTCSCTVVQDSILGKQILAHHSLVVPVSYDTGSKEDDVLGGVTVYWQKGKIQTNGLKFESAATIRGKVLTDYIIQPRTLDFGEIKPGTHHSKKVYFFPNRRSELTVSNIRTTSPFFEAHLIHAAKKVDQQISPLAEIEVTVSAPLTEQREPLNDIIHFSASGEQGTNGEIWVRGTVVPDIEVSPDLIVIARHRVGKTEVTVRTQYPSRVVRIVAQSSVPSSSKTPQNIMAGESGVWETTHRWSIDTESIRLADEINFELEVRNESGRNEVRSGSISIKHLN